MTGTGRIACAGMLFLLSCTAATAAELLITNVAVVSPQHARALPQQNVLVRDGRIVTVSAKPISAATGATRLDGRGKFLTPGLMDSHVHVSDAAGIPFVGPDPALPALRDAYYKQQPRSYLYFGVTQVLDLGGVAAGIAAFEAQLQHPDLFRCGPAPVLDGYPMLFIDKPIRYQIVPDYIYEPANAAKYPLPQGEDPAKHTPEAVVDRIAASGARCVKIYIEGGFGGASDWPLYSSDTLKRIRAATRKRGLLLIAHANAINTQRVAVDAEVDVLAHGVWNWNEYEANEGVPPAIATHLRNVHAKKIGYQPTLRVLAGLGDMYREDTLKDPMYAKVVPPSVLAWYATEPGQWYKHALQHDYGDPPDMKMVHIHLKIGAQGMRATRFLNDLGHPLLLGSDTPSAPTFGNQPGYDTYRELRLMAQSNVPLAAILQAGTINNARQFGLEKDYGTVEPGKIANLLLLTANPLETVRAWTSIDKIILHGAVIERESLAATRGPPRE